MTDVFSPKKRSSIMSKVRGKDTKPEKLVRSVLHRMGYRFRLHRRDLPGSPDIVLPKHKKVIFVHGCFWHGHRGCSRSKRPTSNRNLWNEKIDKNMKRDRKVRRELRTNGWRVLVLWQCRLKKEDNLRKKLLKFMSD